MSVISRLTRHKVERSESSHAVLDAQSRKRKAAKIVAIVSDYIDPKAAEVLDIGTGSGHIASELAKLTKKVVSVDVVDERKVKEGYKFVQAADEKLPFADKSFDVVVSNHVIEHIPSQQSHLHELLRVVKDEGLIYLATPNKLWLRDPHYKLPFISWLPRKLGDRYLKFVNRNAEWDVYPMSHCMLQKWLRGKDFTVRNALPDLVKGSSSSSLDTWKAGTRLLKFVPNLFLDTTKYFSPTLIYIIRPKPKS